MSSSRGRGLLVTSLASAISRSVVSPIAETTATTRSPPSARSAMRRATCVMRSASATELPPYFWTTSAPLGSLNWLLPYCPSAMSTSAPRVRSAQTRVEASTPRAGRGDAHCSRDLLEAIGRQRRDRGTAAGEVDAVRARVPRRLKDLVHRLEDRRARGLVQHVLGRDLQQVVAARIERRDQQRRASDVVHRLVARQPLRQRAPRLLGGHRERRDQQHEPQFLGQLDAELRDARALVRLDDHAQAAEHRRHGVVGVAFELHRQRQQHLPVEPAAGQRVGRQQAADARRRGDAEAAPDGQV